MKGRNVQKFNLNNNKKGMAKKEEEFNPRPYMEKAIKVMKDSIQEPRDDKTSPKVGAVLIKQDGTVDTAFRGELRHGDHAEFTLLERKNRSNPLDDSILFATLEPCAPGSRKHPKLGCAERIVNARIKKVWIGIEDPDPTVDRKGIKYLLDNNIEVEMFDADLQKQIRKENKKFIEGAEDRAKKARKEKPEVLLTRKEKVESASDFDDLSESEIVSFIDKANLKVKYNTRQFKKVFAQLGLIEESEGTTKPTGIGLLLFGNKPQLVFHNAQIRAVYKTSGRGEEIENIEGSLTLQAKTIETWYKKHIGKQENRDNIERTSIYDFPLGVLRETIVNAIVHRDYDEDGAPIYFEINDDAIIIKSPGNPVSPLKFEQIKSFSAPSLSRNPKIMYIFDQLGLVEQRGLGFHTIKELPIKHGIPLPTVTWEAPYLVFTFPRNTTALMNIDKTPGLKMLNDEELMGYYWIQTIDEVSTNEYSKKFKFEYKKAQRQLKKMKTNGLIGDNGEPITSPNYKYKPIK